MSVDEAVIWRTARMAAPSPKPPPECARSAHKARRSALEHTHTTPAYDASSHLVTTRLRPLVAKTATE